jgi:hypothetical protein
MCRKRLKAALLKDPEGILQVADRHSMGHLDKITSLKDLPADKILIAYIKQAARLNKEGVKMPSRLHTGVSILSGSRKPKRMRPGRNG